MVVPDFGVQLVSFQAERCFREFKPFVRTDLDGGSERKKTLQKNEHRQNEREYENRLAPNAV